MVETITVEAEEGQPFIPRVAVKDWLEYQDWIREGERDQWRRHIWGLPVSFYETVPKGKAAKKAAKRERTRLRRAGLK